MEKSYHQPVMVKEVIELLNSKPGCIYVDGTLGGGGHTQAMLEKFGILNSKFKIIAIDQDIEAIEFAKKRLKKYSKNITYIHDNFRNLEAILDGLGIAQADGILLDLGVSSRQLDEINRGFSFKSSHCYPEGAGRPKDLTKDSSPCLPAGRTQNDNLLDMRMDQGQKLSAQDVVNGYREEELKRIFFELGEEPYARQIARAIAIRRCEKPIQTTNDLLAIIRGATPPKYRYTRHGHFASKIFRAVRMEVNHELEALREVLPQAIKRLNKGGRLVIISFHSLEDRIVKHFFREKKNEGIVEILTKKPVTPAPQEIRLNPRVKSAKLRAIEKKCWKKYKKQVPENAK